MAYPQGSNITKDNMVNDFNSIVITGRNTKVVWSTASAAVNPFHPQNTFGTLTSADPNPLGPAATASIPVGDLQTDISGTNVFNVFIGRANMAARIRTVRLIKYLNVTGFASGNGNIVQFNQTQIGSMNNSYSSNFLKSDFTTYPDVNNIVDASDLDTFVSSISQKITALSTTVATFSEYYCHSSCHSSCHGSRGRR